MIRFLTLRTTELRTILEDRCNFISTSYDISPVPLTRGRPIGSIEEQDVIAWSALCLFQLQQFSFPGLRQSLILASPGRSK